MAGVFKFKERVNYVGFRTEPGVQSSGTEKDYLAKKGEVGEYVINLQFAPLSRDHKCLDDLLFSVGDRTTQIDHMVVSP